MLLVGVAVALFLSICFALTATGRGRGVSLECDGKINPNIASVHLLQELPGIGEKRAVAVIDYRQNSASGFSKLQDLQKVKGLGKVTVGKIEHLLTFE